MRYLFIFILATCSYISGFAQHADIWTPYENAVYQRSTTSSGTGGSTIVTFSGSVENKNTATYRIERLDKYGNYISTWKPSQSFPSGSMLPIGTNGGYFYFTLDVPTGWYKVTAEGRWKKFGVGEVFIIAGQSNAQGAGSTYYIPGTDNLDCVVGNRNAYQLLEGNLWMPTFTPISPSTPNIAPRGDRPWYYQLLGNRIATREAGLVIPVAFYNAAHGGSSIDNWYESLLRVQGMFNNNYGNILNYGTIVMTQNPWGYSSFDNRLPYFDLKNTLSYYANMTGVRAVLWHQGEAETKTLLSIHRSADYNPGPVPSGYSINNYDTKLNAIIADTRLIHPNLQWAISKVSLIAETRKNNTFDLNITNSNNRLVAVL